MPPKNRFLAGLRSFASRPDFARLYTLLSILILAGTTIFWSILSAHVEQSNADQLVDPYLFQSGASLHGAMFPSAHTFLLKWPVFWLVRVFGYSSGAYTFFTVLFSLITVGVLALILRRIERRPVVLATLLLALSSVLLMVPILVYSGAPLPDNMAMIATRNIEYAWFMLSLILIVRSPRFRSWRFWLGVLLLAILIASDKLFLAMVLGGGLLATMFYTLTNRSELANLFAKWTINGLLAGAGAIFILWFIGYSGLAHISSQTGALPYSLINNGRNLVLGVGYAVAGIFTNFGANPAADATIVRTIPSHAWSGLSSIGGPAFVINILLLLGATVIALRLLLVQPSGSKSAQAKAYSSQGYQLALLLIWSALAATFVFIFSNHGYAVDARYLTIVLFAAFVSAAVYLSNKPWLREKFVLLGGVLLVSIVFGILSSVQRYQADISTFSDFSQRNGQVVQVLKDHPGSVLVGNYWRVVPIRAASDNKLPVYPLSGCSQVQADLNTSALQPNLTTHPFVYLLTLDNQLGGFPSCSLKEIVAFYGRPNASTLIAGSYKQPTEELLFYDHGIHKSDPTTPQPANGPATVVPVTLDQLPHTACDVPTAVNIVAHQDDDLLFMNPDIIHDIKAGHCVRTIYVTAGDDGAGKLYWLSREQGSEAAYSAMTGDKDIWVQRIVKLSDHEFITVANPRGNSKVSLIFMRLPDGNLTGQGFASSHFESLQKLLNGKISDINAVDGQSYYSSGDLTQALTDLLFTYSPTLVRTQANYISKKYPDHSDHMAVGNFTKKAYAAYEQQQFGGQVTIPLKFYIGYPIHDFAANVSDGDLTAKENVFFQYAKHDAGSCQTLTQCDTSSTFGLYLRRQYQNQY